VAPSSKAFGQGPKGHDDHLHGSIVRGHASAFGQGFINAVPYGANMTPALEARELWKLYQAGDSTVEAVRGVNVSINAGEMVAVMGPSGCGKTTLLNILSGIDEPTSGGVVVNGQPLYGISDDARTDLRGEHFGFIFQDFNLLPVLSAVENVELPLLLKGQPPQEARNEALRALALVGLADRGEHRPAELSGGQQQRVAVARAIVHQPSIILCDEPTGNLDNATSNEVMGLLSEMNQHQGTTFLIVTHDSTIASKCQRTITMSDGNILSDSSLAPHEEE
jgi:putative ABC transport system ATP-binding protein